MVVNDGTEDDPLHFMRNTAGGAAPIGRGNTIHSVVGGDILPDGDMTNKDIDILSRVPSQKLSVLIKRKNTAIRKEKRRREKELLKSQMEKQELEEEENAMLELMKLEGAGNQSERTI